VTEAARDLLGGADERPGRPGQLLGREPIGGPGDGDRGGDLPLGAADRRRRGVQPLLELLDRDGPPPLPRLGELLPQLFDRGHGRCGEALAGLLEQGLERRLRQMRHQHLAARGGVQDCPVPHPVVQRDGAVALRLVDVDGGAAAQHRDVHRLPQLLGERVADRPRHGGQVHAGSRGRGEPEHPDAEPRPARVTVPLHQVVSRQGREQTRRRGCVDPSSRAISPTPADPSRARISITCAARSTDCTVPFSTMPHDRHTTSAFALYADHCALCGRMREWGTDTPMEATMTVHREPHVLLYPRIRKSPFFYASRRDGSQMYSVYLHASRPRHYGDPVTEYWALLVGVTLWDVGVERHIEISGPDAFDFTNLLVTRDLSKCAVGLCKYVFLT